MRLVLVVVGLFLCASSVGCTGYEVRHVDSSTQRLKDDAVFYALPRSVVVLETTVSRTDLVPGRCAPYSDLGRDIGLAEDDMPLLSTTRFKVKSHALSARPEADPTRVYAVRSDTHLLNNLTQSFELSEQGLLGTASVESSNKLADGAVKLVEVTANVAGKLIGMSSPAAPAALAMNGMQLVAAKPNKPVYEVEKAACQAIAARVKAVRDSRISTVVNYGADSPKDALEARIKQLDTEEQSLLAAFTGVRETKETTVRCEVRPQSTAMDFDTYRFSPTRGLSGPANECAFPIPASFSATALAERRDTLVAIAKQFKAAFTESDLAALSELSSSHGPLDRRLIRDLDVAARDDDFQLTKAPLQKLVTGFLDELKRGTATPVAAKKGTAPTDPFSALAAKLAAPLPSTTAKDDSFQVRVRVELTSASREIATTIDTVHPAPQESSGLVYARPVEGWTIVEHTRPPKLPPSIEAKKLLLFPQFGPTVALPGKTAFATMKFEVELYPESGALKKLGSTSTSNDVTEALATAGASAGTVLDAVAAKRKADADAKAAKDTEASGAELNELQRQRQILEEQKKIQDLRKGLDTSVEE